MVTWRRKVDPRFPVLLRGISTERERKCQDEREGGEKKEEGEESAWLALLLDKIPKYQGRGRRREERRRRQIPSGGGMQR